MADQRNGTLTARFSLLASSITGRPVVVAAAQGPGWTNGRIVYVDEDQDVRHQVMLQTALIRAGSLAPAVSRALSGRPTLARRYLTVEGRRALAALAEILPAGALPDPGLLWLPASLDGPEAALALARSRTRLPSPPTWFGVLKPRRALGTEELDPDSPSNLPHDLTLPEQLSDEDDGTGEDSEDNQVSSILAALAGVFGDSPIARALRKQLGSRAGAAKDTNGGAAGASTAKTGRRSTGRGVTVARPEGFAEPVALLAGPRLRLYPEWDDARNAYKPDWCSVIELVPRSDELKPLERPARHDGLRRELAPLGLGLQRRRRQRDGHDLDLDAAIDARIAVASGHTPSDAVYVDNLRRRRELGVLVLLDASGSANELNPTGSALYERQRDAAAALVDTLAILGDRVAGYAFRSVGRDVAVTRFRLFDEPFGEIQMARLGGIGPDGYTRIGAAIRHASHVLLSDKAMVHRLLVVISDGFPYDTGYEGRYAEADARRALSEARTAGVGCLALNLDSGTDLAVLDRVFGSTLAATAKDIDILAPRMRSLIVEALEAARRAKRKGSAA